MSSADPLFEQVWQDRISAAIVDPSRFAGLRVTGESMAEFRARAVACALVYDDEQLQKMGLLRVPDATREWSPATGAEPDETPCPWRMPALERHGVQYHNRPLWADASPLTLAAAIVASVAFVLAVVALMVS